MERKAFGRSFIGKYDFLIEQFPSFRLKDNLSYEGGSVDATLLQVYSRRKSRACGKNMEEVRVSQLTEIMEPSLLHLSDN